MTERVQLLEPWPGPWAKWAYGYCYRNLWRIGHIRGYDLDDAMGEAALVWVETVQRYGHKVNSPAHMMRLFQMSLASWFTDLSNKDTNVKKLLAALPTSEPSSESEANLAVLLNEGSDELKEVLGIFLNAPQEVMNALRAEASSYKPKQFFNLVLKFCNIPLERSEKLQKELTELLT